MFFLFKIYSGLTFLKLECETTFSIVIFSVHCSHLFDIISGETVNFVFIEMTSF